MSWAQGDDAGGQKDRDAAATATAKALPGAIQKSVIFVFNSVPRSLAIDAHCVAKPGSHVDRSGYVAVNKISSVTSSAAAEKPLTLRRRDMLLLQKREDMRLTVLALYCTVMNGGIHESQS